MMSGRKLATTMLDAVWSEGVRGLRHILRMGAGPNWIFSGYPILVRAVFTRNEKIMTLLIRAGAVQVEGMLGFALDRCMGEMIFSLVFLGIVPKEEEVRREFGSYPSRYYPLDCPLLARVQMEGIIKRCAACIRMLQLLRSREFITRGELTQKLSTNVKNILEYRRGLEEVEYVIEGTTGRYGGYQLKSGMLLPVAGLYEEELRSFQESRRCLESHRDFLPYATHYRVVDKFLATIALQMRENGVYVEESTGATGAMISMIRIYEQGRDALSAVEL